ncbi:MAG: hypothetical protein ACKOOF_11280 [Planctomycetaceae bacterium]
MQARAPRRPRLLGLAGAAIAALWCGLLIGPPVAFVRWREGRLAELTAPAVQADWDGFRAAMQRESGRTGPVQRKVPKSAEPPELVWLRDYPALAVTAWVAFVGILGGFVGLLALGMLREAAARSAAENQPRREGDDEEQHQRDAEHTEQRRH